MRHTTSAGVKRAVLSGVAASMIAVLCGCTGAETPDRAPRRTASAPVVLPGAPGDEPRVAGPAEVAKLGDEQAEPSDAGSRYVRMMIPHHQQALTMTAMAPTRAKNPQVRGLAERIDGAQGAEIGMMQAWLARNGVQPMPGDRVDERHKRMMGMATQEQLARLKASSGAEFDRMFLELMSRHHRGAVTMAVDLLKEGTDPQVRSMAKDVMASQRDEIAVMQGLLTEIG